MCSPSSMHDICSFGALYQHFLSLKIVFEQGHVLLLTQNRFLVWMPERSGLMGLVSLSVVVSSLTNLPF